MRRRRIYYVKSTGEPIKDTGETRNPLAVEYSVEEEILMFTELSERNRDTFDVIQLDIGQYAQDFIESRGNYRVNPVTKELEFSYPDPNEPEEPQPFIKPLSVEVDRLKEEDLNNKEAITELYLMSLGGY